MTDDSPPDGPDRLRTEAREHLRAGRVVPALEAFNHLIGLRAATALDWRAIGETLSAVGEHAQAISAFEQSLALDEWPPEAHHGLGQALYRLGEVDRAVSHLRLAAERAGSFVSLLSLASILPGCPGAGHDEVLRVRREFAAWLAAGRGGAPLPARPPRPPHRERIRVGYLSSWFSSANYMLPVYGLLNAHDRRVVEVHLFSDALPDAPLPGYRPGPGDQVHPVAGLDNDAVAEAVRFAGIDVLVDLNGASAPGRLGLFLAPCAPVVLAWFNQYATSGLPGIDGIVGDDEVVRPEEERFYSERVFRLPLSYLTFEVTHPTPPVVPPPAASGGPVRFGSLVSAYKLTDLTLDLWTSVLRAAPESRLLLANAALGRECNRLRIADRFTARGIDPGRVEMLGPAPHREFLAYYDRIDVALDAFPYNGGTTTMEALWQGVPVLSYPGDRWAGRTTASIARRSPAAEFVRADAKDLAAFAGALAADPATPARLAALRRALREDLARSSACDTASLARAMESLYRLTLADPAWPPR